MSKGVQILLQPSTSVPDWILGKTRYVKLDYEKYGGKRPVRRLIIKGGDATFFGGGGVMVKMSRTVRFRGAFGSGLVLEIRDLDGNLVKRNHHLCVKCVAITGEMVSHKPGKIFGRVHAFMRCHRCGSEWEIENL